MIGDRHGTSAAPWLVDRQAARIARRRGFGVALNEPFAGGHIVERHGRPAARRPRHPDRNRPKPLLPRDGRTPGTGVRARGACCSRRLPAAGRALAGPARSPPNKKGHPGGCRGGRGQGGTHRSVQRLAQRAAPRDAFQDGCDRAVLQRRPVTTRAACEVTLRRWPRGGAFGPVPCTTWRAKISRTSASEKRCAMISGEHAVLVDLAQLVAAQVAELLFVDHLEAAIDERLFGALGLDRDFAFHQQAHLLQFVHEGAGALAGLSRTARRSRGCRWVAGDGWSPSNSGSPSSKSPTAPDVGSKHSDNWSLSSAAAARA